VAAGCHQLTFFVEWFWRPALIAADSVLLHVKAVRPAANHQFALLVDDFRLQVVHATVYLLQLEACSADHRRFPVEVHANLVSRL
jgi:hypothetical protein